MRIFHKRIFALFFVLFATPLTFGEKAPFYIFHQLSIKDGLSEGTIRAITEDKRGYIWFGTEDGLNKYDGYKFTVYKSDPKDSFSITSNNIKCFFNDSQGRLWIGTRHGVNLYDYILDRFYSANTTEYPFLKYIEGDIESFMQDRAGNIWVATSTDGLYKITSLQKQPQKFQFQEEGNIRVFMDIDEDSDHNVWVATNDGLLLFDTKKNEFRDLRGQYGNGYQIRDVYIDSTQRVWLATIQGLKCFNRYSGELKEFEHDPLNPNSPNGNNVIRILPEKNGLLLAIDGSGIDLFDPKKETFRHYTKENGTQLNSNNTTALFRDSKGTLWTGTFLNGINFSNVSTNFFVAVKNNSSPSTSVKNGVITCFLKDSDGNFWITTDGNGVNIRRKGQLGFETYLASDKDPMVGSNAAICVIEDNEKAKWIATYAGGLTRIDASGKKTIFRHDPKNPHSVGWNKLKSLCEYQDQIWAATYAMGVTVYNKKTDHFTHYRYDKERKGSLPSDWVYWIMKDSQGTLWLATFEGLCKYVPETDSFITYPINPHGTSVDKNYIFDIYEDQNKNFWLGTNGGGLVIFDRKSEKFTSYTVNDGLSDNAVRTIIQDNRGDLWLGTNNGISQFDIATRKATPYTINDGLPAGSFFFNCKYIDEEGKVYFGMNDGYLVIDPALANEKTDYPQVVLTELRIFNTPVGPTTPHSPLNKHISEAKQIQLPYDQNSLSVEFAALNFNTPKHNYYAYKLEGFDKNWNYSGKNRVAKYTNLDPGRYVLRIKASNNKKIWGNDTYDFVIIIDSPFWDTWWFKIAGILLVLSGTFGVFYARTKRIRDRNRWLSEQVREKTKELLDKKNELEASNAQLQEWSQFQNKLIGILGHDIRGPLQNFSLLLQLQDEKSEAWVKTKLKETADSLSILATDLLSWVSLQSQKGEVAYSEFNWAEVLEKAQAQLAPAIKSKKLTFVLKDNETHQVKGVPPMVLACLRNILSNSIRFSPEGATIELETGIRKDGYAGLRITDHGQGFDAEKVNRLIQGEAFTGVKDSNLKESAGLGLAICYDMVKRTGGWAEAASLPGSGATFFIYLPVASLREPILEVEKAVP